MTTNGLHEAPDKVRVGSAERASVSERWAALSQRWATLPQRRSALKCPEPLVTGDRPLLSVDTALKVSARQRWRMNTTAWRHWHIAASQIFSEVT